MFVRVETTRRRGSTRRRLRRARETAPDQPCRPTKRETAAGEDASEIADAVDHSGRRRAAALAAEIERDCAGEVTIRSDQEKADRRHERDAFPRVKASPRRNDQRDGREDQAGGHDRGAAGAAEAIVQDSRDDHRHAAQQRKPALCLAASSLLRPRADRKYSGVQVLNVSRDRVAERQSAGEPEPLRTRQRTDQTPHRDRAGRAGSSP